MTPLDFQKPSIEWFVYVWEVSRAHPRCYIEPNEVKATERVADFKMRLLNVPALTVLEEPPLCLIVTDTLSMNLVGVICAYPHHFWPAAKDQFASITGSREGTKTQWRNKP